MFVAATGVRKKDGSCRYVALESRVVGLYSGRLPLAEHLDFRQFFQFFAQADPAFYKPAGRIILNIPGRIGFSESKRLIGGTLLAFLWSSSLAWLRCSR